MDELSTVRSQSNTFSVITRSRPSTEFAPSLLLANVMSLVPKVDEIRVLVSQRYFDFLFLTETWLRNVIGDNQVSLESFNLIRRDRLLGVHGGVCLYIRAEIKFRRLDELENNDFEVLWVYTRPKRLPRGVPCVILGCVYHPPSANDHEILDYISESLIKVEGLYPGCAIIIAGDFNKLNIKLLKRNFQLKQLVRSPTRGSNILDLVLTNLHIFYDPTSIKILPPFGLSDHNTISICPKQRAHDFPSRRTVLKRDTRPSRKTELGRYLNEIDWSLFHNLETCEQKNAFFHDIISNGFNLIMPERKVKFHTNDAPWITEEFKQLIKSRQRAFSSGNS